jgi:predicted CopG family antitoxin
MVRTITIKDGVFSRLSMQKGRDESFSDLFERLLDNQLSGIMALTTIRGSVEFDDSK